ncbi:transcriptional regulator FilR1 domain-containing protein [Halorubrum pallidum]
MTDRGPGAVLRSLVDRAVDADGVADSADAGSDDSQVVVAERDGDPDPADLLSTAVSGGTAASGGAEVRLDDDCGDSESDAAEGRSGSASIVGVVPQIEMSTVRRLRDAIDGPGAEQTVRLVFTGTAAARLSGGSGAVLRSALARHGIEAAVHDGDSPIAVLLVGERAVVGLFDGDGLAALLCSDAPAIRSWAAGVYRRYAAAVGDTDGATTDDSS